MKILLSIVYDAIYSKNDVVLVFGVNYNIKLFTVKH